MMIIDIPQHVSLFPILISQASLVSHPIELIECRLQDVVQCPSTSLHLLKHNVSK